LLEEEEEEEEEVEEEETETRYFHFSDNTFWPSLLESVVDDRKAAIDEIRN